MQHLVSRNLLIIELYVVLSEIPSPCKKFHNCLNHHQIHHFLLFCKLYCSYVKKFIISLVHWGSKYLDVMSKCFYHSSIESLLAFIFQTYTMSLDKAILYKTLMFYFHNMFIQSTYSWTHSSYILCIFTSAYCTKNFNISICEAR